MEVVEEVAEEEVVAEVEEGIEDSRYSYMTVINSLIFVSMVRMWSNRCCNGLVVADIPVKLANISRTTGVHWGG